MRIALHHCARAAFVLVLLAVASAKASAQHPNLTDERPTDEACLSCHENVREAVTKASHKALEHGCLSCHDVSKDVRSPYLRLDPNRLCLACHHVPLPPGAAPPVSVEIARGFAVPGSFLSRTRQLNLDQRGVGHPVINHPVAGRSDPLRQGQTFGCLSCHVSHGSDSPKLLLFKLAPGEGICQKCHQV